MQQKIQKDGLLYTSLNTLADSLSGNVLAGNRVSGASKGTIKGGRDL